MAFSVAAGALFAAQAARAFDPASGDWHKSDPTHLRVMTFNIEDGIGIGVPTTPATPTTVGSQWAYIGLICQALAPDVICLQEVEPSDPPATTQVWVQNWANEYFGSGVMHVYVSAVGDTWNRNVNVSRFPFGDLNGDNVANDGDIYVLGHGAGSVPPGTAVGMIRGWTQSEIDLPDAIYRGDLFIGNSHLRSGGTQADKNERLYAAQNMAYWINTALNTHAFPYPWIPPNPLEAATPVVLCGDMNSAGMTMNDPVPWLRGYTSAAGDGTDRDLSEMLVAPAADPFTGSIATHDSGSRFDYIIVQDSIATVVHAFVFSSQNAAQQGALPPELAAVAGGSSASTSASDHRAVVVDLALPLVVPGDLDGDGDVDAGDHAVWAACLQGPVAGLGSGCGDADLDDDGHVDLRDFARLIGYIAP